MNFKKSSIKPIHILLPVAIGLVIAGFWGFATPTQKAEFTASIQDGLVGYWNMDEADIYGSTLYDKSGFGNHGTIHGATTTTGKIKQALSFDGESDYVSQSYSSDFDFGTGSFSIFTWFKSDAGMGPKTLDLQVGANLDDVHEKESTGAAIDHSTVMIHQANTNADSRYWAGHRWIVELAQGTTINDAYASLYVYSYLMDDVSGNWHFEKAASPVRFSTTNYDITNRIRTTASVSWIEDSVAPNEAWVDTPSLVTPLQEVLDNFSVTALVLIFRPNQDIYKYLATRPYNSDTNLAAKLHVEYSSPLDYFISRYDTAGWKTWLDGSGNVCFGIDDDATWTAKDSVCSSGTNYDDGQWHNVQLVKDGTSGVYLYIDGQLAASETELTATGSLSGTSPDLYLGIDSDGSSNPWQGEIDDVRIYNRALSAGEVLQNYSASGRLVIKSSLGTTTIVSIPLVEEEFICGGTVTFTYRGEEVIYGTIYNSATGKCWMDRNLGAEQVAVNATDTLAYGDLFQWGRLDDDHQDRSLVDPATNPDRFTTTQATTTDPGHNKFIYENSNWLNYTDDTLWQGDGGTNDPCPTGWQVPTKTELEDEMNSWDTGISDRRVRAYNSIKLTAAGFRYYFNGSLSNVGTNGLYWSSMVDVADAWYLYFDSGSASMYDYYRANGFSVRCVQD